MASHVIKTLHTKCLTNETLDGSCEIVISEGPNIEELAIEDDAFTPGDMWGKALALISLVSHLVSTVYILII